MTIQIVLPPCPQCGHETLTFDPATVVETQEPVQDRGYIYRYEANVPVQRIRPVVMCWTCEFAAIIDLKGV